MTRSVRERWRIGYVPQRHTVAGGVPSSVEEVVASGRLAHRRLLSRTTPADRAAAPGAAAGGEPPLVVQTEDGAVRAMVGGRDYGQSQFNRATDALRQPGSSFKPFVYAAALSHMRLRPNSIVRDTPVCIGNWCPSNYNRSFAGAMPLTSALARSINSIPVRMSAD